MPSASGDSILMKIRHNNLCHRYPVALPLVYSELVAEILSLCRIKANDKAVLYSKSTELADQQTLNKVVEQYERDIRDKPLPRPPLLVDVKVHTATLESKQVCGAANHESADGPHCSQGLLPSGNESKQQIPRCVDEIKALGPRPTSEEQIYLLMHKIFEAIVAMNKRMDNFESMLDSVSTKLKYRAKVKRARKSASQMRPTTSDSSLECCTNPKQAVNDLPTLTNLSPSNANASNQHENAAHVASLQVSTISNVDIYASELSISALLLPGGLSTSSSSSILTNTSVLSDSSAHRLMSQSGNLNVQLIDEERIETVARSEPIISDQENTIETVTSEVYKFPEQGFSESLSPSTSFQDSILQSSVELQKTNTNMSESERFDYVEVSYNRSRLGDSENFDMKETDEEDGYIALLESSSQSFTIDPQYESSLQMLRDSGYPNLKMNLALLKEYEGDLIAVTKALEDYAEFVEY